MTGKELFNHFQTGTEFREIQNLGKGNIHETFLAESGDGRKFVLQKINNNVFKDPVVLMENSVIISNHLNNKRMNEGISWTFPRFYQTGNGNYLLVDDEGSYWRLMDFIENSPPQIAGENIYLLAGSSYAELIRLLSDLPVDLIRDTIPDFHNLAYRLSNFKESIGIAAQKTLAEARDEIRYLMDMEDIYSRLEHYRQEGRFPVRLTHNDTKIDNILFDEGGNPIAIIDLDTVMQGIVHSDFGDAIRSFASSAEEDEPDLSKVSFRLDVFRQYTQGFTGRLREILTEDEKKTLILAPFMWVYMQAVRFLTDFLDGNTYYKINYPEHNLVRTRNQVRLLQSMQDHYEKMEQLITHELK